MVRYRDLVADAPQHFSPDLVRVFRTREPGSHVLNGAQSEIDLTEELIEEFIGTICSSSERRCTISACTQLKAWIDRVVQPGRTFRFTPEGPVGLCQQKSAIIVSSRGSIYGGTPLEAALDHQEAHLRAIFGFLGFTSIEIVRAEGLDITPEIRHRALEGVSGAIRTLIDARFQPVAATG